MIYTWSTATYTAWSSTSIITTTDFDKFESMMLCNRANVNEFDISAFTADHTAFGDIIIGNVWENGSLFDLMYADTNGWRIAREIRSGMMVLRLETGTGQKRLLREGFIYDDSWAWTVGGLIYAGTFPDDGISQTKPTPSICLGVAMSAKIIYFKPEVDDYLY